MTLTASPDAEAIRALIDDVAAGVNARDVDRCLAPVAEDAVFVVANGARAHGRAAVREAHLRAFAGTAAAAGHARFELLDVAFPRPDLAIATTGAYRAGPGEPVDHDRPPMVVVWVLTRDHDRWLVVARQFTPVT